MAARLGIGTYRMADTDPEHALALQAALDAGFSIIDTASTYANGGSEALVGNTLASRPHSAVTLITKVGIAEGFALELLRRYSTFGKPLPGTIEFGEQLSHCLHPEFLDDVLHASLQRLQRDYVDVLLLHNPEMQLQRAHQQGTEVTQARNDVYHHIATAFAWLEEQVAAGRIGSYGISANTFGAEAESADFLSLGRCVELAHQIGGSGHGFRYAQMPFNIIEHQAATTANHADLTVLDVAVQHGIHVLANRPLNAIANNELIRLVSYDVPAQAAEAHTIESRIHELEIQEHDVLQQLIASIAPAESELRLLQESFRVAGALCQSWNKFEGLVHYRDVRKAHLDTRVAIASRYQDAKAYVESITGVLNGLDMLYAMEENASLEELRQTLCDVLGQPPDTPLQHLALHAVRNTPGIGTVLVGMRKREYVRDVSAAMLLEPVQCGRSTWEAINDHLHRLSAD